MRSNVKKVCQHTCQCTLVVGQTQVPHLGYFWTTSCRKPFVAKDYACLLFLLKPTHNILQTQELCFQVLTFFSTHEHPRSSSGLRSCGLALNCPRKQSRTVSKNTIQAIAGLPTPAKRYASIFRMVLRCTANHNYKLTLTLFSKRSERRFAAPPTVRACL